MISIHRALAEDAAALSQIAFAAKAHWGYPERWLEIWKPQLTFSSEYFEQNESWMAEEDGVPMGFYTLQDKAGNAWIENLWVSPEFIGRGIGKQLFLYAAELSRQRDYKTLQLEADPNAVGFYKKMGMVQTRERHSEVESQPRILPVMEMNL